MKYTEMQDAQPIHPDIDLTGEIEQEPTSGVYFSIYIVCLLIIMLFSSWLYEAKTCLKETRKELQQLKEQRNQEDIDKKLSEMADARRRVEEAKKAQRIVRSKP